MNNEQAILEKLRELPPEKQQEVLDFVEFLRQKNLSKREQNGAQKGLIDRSRELNWLNENREKYEGEWVALDGDHLLSHGMNAREVYEQARKSGVEIPFLAQVEPKDQLPFGGW